MRFAGGTQALSKILLNDQTYNLFCGFCLFWKKCSEILKFWEELGKFLNV